MSLFTVKSNENTLLLLISDFTSLFFPEYCLGCSSGLVKGEEILCTHCILDLPFTGYQFMDGNPIQEKFLARLPIRYAGALLKFRKTGIVQHLLHQLKYNNHPEVGIRLGKIFGREIKELGMHYEFDMIIPIPLHKSREKKRGYNQSTKFAEGLMHELKVPCMNDLVVRLKNTSTQTRKSKTERWENVEHAFGVIHPSAVENKRILLVDDIITTGASLEACGKQLLDYGCSELSIACIAEAQ